MAAPSNFDFLQPRWPGFHTEARRVERDTLFDPLSTCFFARRTLEVAVGWMYRADKSLTLPYKDDLNARLFEPTFKTLVGPTIHVKRDLIRRLGNRAAHQGGKQLTNADALGATRDLFHIMFWLATTYAPSPTDRPDPYEPPFTDLAPTGPEQLFPVDDVDLLVAALEHIRRGASVAS